MNRVAVFGNAGGGKSTLSKRLAEITGLPLVPLDLLQYKPGGEQVSAKEFKLAHDQVMQQSHWIIDGFGSMDTLWERLAVADTLVYLDMPVLRHYWWVTKRLLQGLWVAPEGWPEGSSLWQGTLNSYKTVGLCHQKLTPRYRAYLEQVSPEKQVYHLRSLRDVKKFEQTVAGR